MSSDLKILLLDLELTFAIYYAYPSKREQYLSANNIIHDQFCTCAAWKWHHESSTYVVKITDDRRQFKNDFRNDRNVAVKLHAIMEEADIIVAHNGDNFDIKHANTLFEKHGLGPIPERKSIDTLKLARKYFAFPGNSLDQLSKRFGSKGKNKKPNWYKMTDGDAKEINIAAKYCKNDVNELEVIFNKLKPFMNQFPSERKYKDHISCCESCGSKRLRNKGKDFDGSKSYERVICGECGHNHKCKFKFISPKIEKKLHKKIHKCPECKSLHLINHGSGCSGFAKFYRVDCLDCGENIHSESRYEKNHK